MSAGKDATINRPLPGLPRAVALGPEEQDDTVFVMTTIATAEELATAAGVLRAAGDADTARALDTYRAGKFGLTDADIDRMAAHDPAGLKATIERATAAGDAATLRRIGELLTAHADELDRFSREK
jgi:hypothetical protein